MNAILKAKSIVSVLCVLLAVALLSGCGKWPKAQKFNWDVMSRKEAEDVYPGGYDIAAAKKAGLIKRSVGEERYQRMEAAYLYVLNEILEEKVNLSGYEKRLEESGYNFYPVEDNLYYRFNSYGRNNIYLRNNAYIERLSKEQLAMLEQAVTPSGIVVTPELKEMVSKTWKEIITVHLEEDMEAYRSEDYDALKTSEPHMINYEMDAIGSFQAENDALTFVLGFCAEYDSAGNANDYQERQKYIIAEKLTSELEKDLSEELNCHVKVFIIIGDHQEK